MDEFSQDEENAGGTSPTRQPSPLDSLTAKQREVLDLLVQHKTSKEISRELGISPHTVDQRLTQARAKLGVSRRGEVANEYQRLVSIYEETTYRFPYMANGAISADPGIGTTTGAALAERPTLETLPRPVAGQVLDYRVGPAYFEGRWGTLARLMAILLIALALVFVVMGGVTMFMSLSHLLGR